MPNPSYMRREVASMLPIWQQIQDCIEGETAIKGIYHPGRIPSDNVVGGFASQMSINSDVVYNSSNSRYYLPQPNSEDNSQENMERYKSYVGRAQFYPVTSRTADGLTGQVFQRDPEMKLPTEMTTMVNDLDGNGLDILQVAQKQVRTILNYGRSGLLTDYPQTDKPTTKQQLEDGDVRPVILCYDPWNIVNWTTKQRCAKRVLNMVVLREVVDVVGEDGFEMEQTEQFRVLRLNSADQYTVEIWEREGEDKNGDWSTTLDSLVTPKDSTGKPLNFIPFQFVGAESNDWFVDKPPMADIASLNIGHYRNSADYEESCFLCGQATPVFSGLEQSWVDKNFANKQIKLGSRKAVVLGENAKAELLQAQPNSMPMEAMKHKEEQMMAIGAKLITQNKTTRTATETTVQQSSENSTLGNIAVNVGTAMTQALKWAALFLGVQTTLDENGKEIEISYVLNSDFDLSKKSPQEVAQMVANWQAGVTSWTECRVSLRASGYTSQSDEEAKAEISEEKAAAFLLGGHPIADPFDIPPGTTPPSPLPPPGSPADNAVKAAAKAAAVKSASRNQSGVQTAPKKAAKKAGK